MMDQQARRQYDLIEVCKKYIPIGISFDDLEIILHAAGVNFNLQPGYNHSLPENSPDRQDVGSGYVLYNSPVSNAIFQMFFRPEKSNNSKKILKQIRSCRATVNSL